MAGDEPRQPTSVDPVEERLLRRLKLIAGVVMLVMIILLVTADTLGRLFISPDFHASELILGIEGLNRLPGGRR
jgi:hypothetical protein